MQKLWQDVRYATRMMWKNPGVTLVVVISLAIGIGANTMIFSVINAVLLRPLPGIAQQNRLADIHGTDASGKTYRGLSYPDYEYYRDENKVFDGLLAMSYMSLSLNEGQGTPERVFGLIVTGNYFDVLGARPEKGRFFQPDEDKTPGTHPVAVVSYGLWQRRFGSDPALVGKNVTINGHPFTVVGIAPKGFGGMWVGMMPDVWVPMMMHAQARPGEDQMKRDSAWLKMRGRLKEGVTLEQAQAEMTRLARQLEQEFPETNRGKGVSLETTETLPGKERRKVVVFMSMLMIVVGLVLLIACANVAGIFLARAAARSKEIAIRTALGASRFRIIRQLLTESMMLFLIGGIAGVIVGVWTTSLLFAFKPSGGLQFSLEIGLDWSVLIFTLLVSLGTGLIFGLAPAVKASRTDVVSSLKAETAGGSSRRSRGREVFVITQFAVSLVLLIGAGLFLRSLQRARTINPGFNPDGIYTMFLDLTLQGYDETRAREFYRQIVERVGAAPGVRGVSLARLVPLSGEGSTIKVKVAGQEPPGGEDAFSIDANAVDERYFQLLGVPLVRGRNFSGADLPDGPQVAVINETMAQRFYGTVDAVGRTFVIDSPDKEQSITVEVIGVAKDGKYETLGEDPRPYIYLSFLQSYAPVGTLHVSTTPADAPGVIAAIRREVQALDPNLPILEVRPMVDQVGFSLVPLRLAATVVGILGLLGLLLAAVGIFGTVSYSVAQRTREIGIRMALGARSRDVLWQVVRQGMWLALIGIAGGLLLAFLMTRALTSLLYGVSATDPTIFAGIALLLAAVAFVASYIPARRATRVDPMVALRYE